MEAEVRKIEADGLLWGTGNTEFANVNALLCNVHIYLCYSAKLVPLAFGIHKLQISTVVEDEKVSIDWLTEQIEALEDYVSWKPQSMECCTIYCHFAGSECRHCSVQ